MIHWWRIPFPGDSTLPDSTRKAAEASFLEQHVRQRYFT